MSFHQDSNGGILHLLSGRELGMEQERTTLSSVPSYRDEEDDNSRKDKKDTRSDVEGSSCLEPVTFVDRIGSLDLARRCPW